jgi:hypothetical protein
VWKCVILLCCNFLRQLHPHNAGKGEEEKLIFGLIVHYFNVIQMIWGLVKKGNKMFFAETLSTSQSVQALIDVCSDDDVYFVFFSRLSGNFMKKAQYLSKIE